MWMNKRGNREIFLNPKLNFPYEQTWMSIAFQKHNSKIIKTGLLLLSPINHDRIQYYGPNERKEN
jgi:hypothetical protein